MAVPRVGAVKMTRNMLWCDSALPSLPFVRKTYAAKRNTGIVSSMTTLPLRLLANLRRGTSFMMPSLSSPLRESAADAGAGSLVTDAMCAIAPSGKSTASIAAAVVVLPSSRQ